MHITSLKPLRLLVLTIKSLASAGGGDGSSGCRITFLSSGSPGTTAQWSKTCWQKAWPCVKDRKSVSNPKLYTESGSIHATRNTGSQSVSHQNTFDNRIE